MRAIRVPLRTFKINEFLKALHHFDLAHGGDGNPLPGIVGDSVHHDPSLLAEALAADVSAEIPSDSLRRLEVGLTLYGQTAAFGMDGLDCVDGGPIADEGDECLSYGLAIALVGGFVEIEGRCLSDVTGECELEPMTEPNRISGRMRRWVRSFVTASPKRNAK